jgi:hypothetical protein
MGVSENSLRGAAFGPGLGYYLFAKTVGIPPLPIHFLGYYVGETPFDKNRLVPDGAQYELFSFDAREVNDGDVIWVRTLPIGQIQCLSGT